MDGDVPARFRDVFRSIAFMVFMVTSAYLLLELVIALSAQGEPTGAVAPFTGAEVIYPLWYQAPEFLDAAWVALVAYPLAAILHAFGMVADLARRRPMVARPPMRPDAAVQETPAIPDAIAPATAQTDDRCVVGGDRRIEHITPATARLFGLAPREMMGRSLEAFLSPVDLPKLDALVAAAYAERPRAFTTTVGILLPGALVAPVDITCAAGVEGVTAAPGTTVITIRPFAERGRLDDHTAALWY